VTAPSADAPGEPPVAVLAIDGGNSKTDVALVASDGRLLAQARGPGGNPQTIGVDGTVGVIDDLVRRAAASAGIALHAGAPVATHLAAYLAGVDVPQEQSIMDAALRRTAWARSVAVDNDTFAIFRAGTHSHWGIGVVSGAGINAVGIGPDGRMVRFPAIGVLSGDWGGGGDLSRLVLWHAIRDEDGRGEPTRLRQAVIDHFGTPTVRDAVIGLHLGELSPSERLGLTHVLFDVAADADPVAVGLVNRQAQEVALLVKSTMRQLDLEHTATDVVLGGGVLTSRNPLLMRFLDRWMEHEAPKAQVRINDVPAVTGAALLGLDHLGIGGDAEDALRASMRVSSPGPPAQADDQPLDAAGRLRAVRATMDPAYGMTGWP
jgi:N-acetylglucosamine kinase-like BadF-type ATPase